MKSLLKLFRTKTFLASALVVLASALAINFHSSTAQASNCPGKDDDTNAIMRCGFNGVSGFETKFNANDPNDLDNIYAHFGFTSADMSRIKSEGKWGWAKDNKTIVLDDGRVVATNAASMGRESWGTQRNAINIDGNGYFWSYLDGSFADGVHQLRVLVLMDKEDKYMQFAVMDACGNPTWGELPKFNCKMLTADKSEKFVDETFNFNTTVELKNSTVKNYHYDFGDGTTKDSSTANVSHSYSKAGKYHITVTVTYTVNGVETNEKLQLHCQTDVEVKEKKIPEFSCTLLQPISLGDLKYKFTGKTAFKDTELVSATFDFGDGSTGAGVIANKTATSADVTAEHQYAAFTGKKTITLSVEFKIGSDRKNANCQTEIAREIESACVPQKGENEKCEIPATGPAEMFAAAAGAGGLGAAGVYYRASRKNLSSLLDKFKR